ncbi:MAG: 50S ribosomal protein L15 [Bacteroidetes bacterium]|nr:50S ribosomal protein L15 [Bacteroidota bacterium]
MTLSNLKPAKGSLNKEKRIGRGQGSGHGQSSTRGTKGQQSRTGYQRKMGHEGGQMPLQRRLPKFGFVNPFTIKYQVINIDRIQKIASEKNLSEINPEIFSDLGLVSAGKKIKILGNGKIEVKIIIKAHAFSKTAKSAIESAGGSAEVVK